MSAISSFHRRAALAVGIALVAGGVSLARNTIGSLLLVHATWLRPAAAGQNGAGYFEVVNLDRTADKLIAAASPAAMRVSIHESRMVGSVMTMRAVSAVAIPRGVVDFHPGGLHLMLEGLKRPLKVGERVPVTLVFAKAGRTALMFTVCDTCRGPPASAMPGMKM